jgi:C1A family cysteine protease
MAIRRATGWLRDYPDFRDYTPEHESIAPLLKQAKIPTTEKTTAKSLPTTMDLRQWFSPVENQLNLGSCTANAGVGLVEYFEKRAFGKHTDASRLFLYKVTRRLLSFTGDSGAFLRGTMGALALFGVPPEEFWPYTDDATKFDEEPPAFCYSFAQNYQAIKYFRLDPPGYPADKVLTRIKTTIAAGMPVMFGFSVYNSIFDPGVSDTGKIPYPGANDSQSGGHAIVAAGYDDKMEIAKSGIGEPGTKGAFLIRNSWGEEWGDKGYGWLPYEYVLKGLADDWWSLVKSEWIDTGQFMYEAKE